MTEASEPVVQVNTWMANTSPAHVLFATQARYRDEDSLVLEDMQTDEEKLHGSLLSSESAFLPVSSVVRSPSPVDSEEEDLDEPDSLAPPNPARSHPAKVETETNFPLNLNHSQTNIPDHTAEKGEHLQTNRIVQLQDIKDTNISEAGTELSVEVADCPPNAAAVKIQAWWRGYWTRQQHPQAKEVRCEIRLRRLQDHIVYLTTELERYKALIIYRFNFKYAINSLEAALMRIVTSYSPDHHTHMSYTHLFYPKLLSQDLKHTIV